MFPFRWGRYFQRATISCKNKQKYTLKLNLFPNPIQMIAIGIWDGVWVFAFTPARAMCRWRHYNDIVPLDSGSLKRFSRRGEMAS